ncbi:MAG: autotransporter-associated beta strand repeat-containing protein, partial [Opitutae bacterium]|nr:autotransporter-associated beta strand repeat-containing protein [Opitutae bacterium]
GALTISVANTGDIGAVINEGGDLTISTDAGATTTIESITASAGTLTTSGNGSLSVTSMVLSSEAQTQLGGSSLTVETLNFTAGHTLNISAAAANITTLKLASTWGTSTLNSANLKIGTLNWDNGDLSVASGGTGNVTVTNLLRGEDAVDTVLTVGEGGSLSIGTLSLNTTASTTIDVGGSFSVENIVTSATGLLTFSGNSLTIDSSSTTVTGDLYLAYAGSDETSTLTLAGLSGKELHLLGGGVAITSDTSFETFVRNGSDETITTNGTLTIGEDATATFTSMEVNAAHALDIAGAGKLSAETLSVLGSGSFKIETGSFEVETFTAGNTGEMTLASSGSIDALHFLGGTINVDADVSVGVLSRSNIDNADSMTADGSVVIASGSTLTIGESATISSSYTTSISGEGTLDANGANVTIAGSSAVAISTSSVSIGTLVNNNSVSSDTDAGATISSASGTIGSLTNNSGKLTIGSQTATTDYTIGSITQNGGTLKIYATTLKTDSMTGTSTINLGNTTISLATQSEATFDATLWLETSTTPTFDVSEGQSLTLSGAINGDAGSGTGTLVKTGEGKLTLSGSNTYYGGTTISAGALVAGSSSALGNGKVTIDSGAKLEISEGATVSNELVITLGVANMKSTANTSIAVARADGGDYVITGEGVLVSTAISISVDEAVLSVIADGAESYDFYVVSADTSDGWESSVSITLSSELTSAGYTVATMSNGILTIGTPEPSMFGVFAGLGALALVATRRRRSRKAA